MTLTILLSQPAGIVTWDAVLSATSSLSTNALEYNVASAKLPASSTIAVNAKISGTIDWVSVLEDFGLASGGALTYTTASFTPPANSLLVVSIGIENGPLGDVRVGCSVSGGGLVWTKQLGPDGSTISGFTDVHELWTAPVGGSPTSMTLNITSSATNDSARVLTHIDAYIGYNVASPIGSTGNNTLLTTDGNAAASMTLSAAPALKSYVHASRYWGSVGADTTASPGAGWTEIHDTNTGGGSGSLQSQNRTGSTSTSIDWTNTGPGETAWNNSGLAVEIKALTSFATFQATALLAPTASLSVDTDQIWRTNPAVIAATSSLTANTTQTFIASSILAATSSLAVNGLAYDVASATLPCTSVVSCDAKVYKPAFATLPASTTLSVNASIAVRGAAILPITSDLSAASQSYLIGRAILNATSALSVFGSQPFTFATLFASSDLSALVSIRWPSAAVLPLSSSIVVDTNIKGTVFAAATLAPTSILSCATVQRLATLSVLPLNSSLFSDSIQRGNIFTSATLSSTAALSCVAAQRWTSVASLDSTASLIAGTIQRWQARAQCDAALILKANVGQKWLSIAKLPGESVFSAGANATSAGDQPIILKSTSTLHVETIFVRLERHWRRHLTATGSTGLPKQIRGVRNRTTLSGNVS